jgi:hypothetical protein
MIRKFILTGAAVAVAVSLNVTAFAGANDYVFEPVKSEVTKGDGVIVSVRLKHKATGKPVSDAIIVQKRIDMSPGAMGEWFRRLPRCRATSPASIRSRPISRCQAAGS